MVNRLLALGLVERRPRDGDQRSWELRPTAAGAAALAELAPALDELNGLLVDTIGAGALDGLVDALDRLARLAPR